jgi:ubiquinone/menaquinone biosynthesis C-methylase UbiE
MTSYVYDPKSDIERERLLERDKRTSLRRSVALEGIDLPSGASILDVGSGTGVLGFDLVTRFPSCSLFCVDIEPSILVEASRDKPAVGISMFIASDAYRLPFNGASFDVTSCQYLLQHLIDPVKVLSEMRRVSKKGALAIVFEWDDGATFIHPELPNELDRVFGTKSALVHRGGR